MWCAAARATAHRVAGVSSSNSSITSHLYACLVQQQQMQQRAWLHGTAAQLAAIAAVPHNPLEIFDRSIGCNAVLVLLLVVVETVNTEGSSCGLCACVVLHTHCFASPLLPVCCNTTNQPLLQKQAAEGGTA